jgi:hypothetical protein
MSNQKKSELVSDNFGIQSFQDGQDEISPRDRFMPKGPVCPEFLFQQPGQVPTAVTHKALTV